MIKINNYISYIPATNTPLSADVCFIECTHKVYIFDVGSNQESLNEINNLIKEKTVILSHFHQDHCNNIKKLLPVEIYLGKKTFDYVKSGKIINEKIMIKDGITLEIIPIPSTHSKGSLVLNCNYEYLFVGDALYMTTIDNKKVYNVQLLKETIESLKRINTKFILLSHDEKFIYTKEEVIKELEEYYSKRIQNNPYIYYC